MPLMTPAEILEGAGPIRQPAAALVAQWVAAIPSVGFGQPVVIGRDGRVIGGLARVLAARELGLAQVPVVRLGAPRGPKRNASRARPVGFDPKAGGLGVLGGLVWRPAVYSRHEVAWVSARAWRDTSKPEDLRALKAAKAARDPAVLEAAASELATILRQLRGDWADHAVAPVPCGHSGTGDCFGKRLAQQVAEALGTAFVELWQDRPLAGVSHPARNARLPEFAWLAEPAGPVLVVDDVASTGAHLEQALMALSPKHHRKSRGCLQSGSAAAHPPDSTAACRRGTVGPKGGEPACDGAAERSQHSAKADIGRDLQAKTPAPCVFSTRRAGCGKAGIAAGLEPRQSHRGVLDALKLSALQAMTGSWIVQEIERRGHAKGLRGERLEAVPEGLLPRNGGAASRERRCRLDGFAVDIGRITHVPPAAAVC